MFDSIPALARHAIILCLLTPLVALVGVFTLAVITTGGVFDVPSAGTARGAVDAGGVSLAAGLATMIALYATPLTRQYRLGSATGTTGADPVHPEDDAAQ